MTIRPGPRAGLWALLVSVVSVGCAHFEPTLPLRAQAMDVDLQLQELYGTDARQVVYTSRSREPHETGRAWLTVATRVPCSGGLEANGIVVDDGHGVSGVLPAGTHKLRARFGPDADAGLDLVFDMEIERGGCLRAPVVSQSVPFVVPKRFVLATSMDLGFNGDLAGMRTTVGFRVGGGGWLGPVLVTAVVGIGGAVCSEEICGKDANNELHSGLMLPAALDLRYNVGASSSRANRLTNAFLVGARYSIAATQLPALDGERRFVVHGFQGVISWGFADPVRGPVLHRERMPFAELALPVGVYWSPDAPANHLVFAAGVDLRFLIPL